MGAEQAKAHLRAKGLLGRVIEPSVVTATVAEAAAALGCEPCNIAKSLSFAGEGAQSVLVVAAGDAKVDNRKFRERFGFKPHMLSYEEVEPRIGHAVGGVCPFGVKPGVEIYCDISLRRFKYVYPAAGNDHSGVKLTGEELYQAADALDWVDVCKGWYPDV